ncbi:MAG: GntR family transcriptional regulator [Hyphomicrobiaceae bacterium]|nr:GntR family transcriptional regulator [Hyphomicrobiaceae bacterium]
MPKTRPAEPRDGERLPKYLVIRNWVLGQISDGTFVRGTQLPSEHDVMTQFGVSRVTARQAFDALRVSGVVEARRGKGYFVSGLCATASLERLQSFGEMMAPLGVATHSDVLGLMEIPADRHVADALRVDAGSAVIHLARARKAGSTLISLDIGYLPRAIGRKLMLLDLARQDVFLLMEKRLDIEIGYADLTLAVEEVPAALAPLLGVKAKDRVLCLKRLTLSNSGEPLMFERIYARLDVLQFRVRVPRW